MVGQAEEDGEIMRGGRRGRERRGGEGRKGWEALVMW